MNSGMERNFRREAEKVTMAKNNRSVQGATLFLQTCSGEETDDDRGSMMNQMSGQYTRNRSRFPSLFTDNKSKSKQSGSDWPRILHTS